MPVSFSHCFHIMIRYTLLVALGLTPVLAAGGSERAAGPVDIGTTKQLFIDDFVIDKMVGLKKVLNQPARHAENPIVKPEHPWEGRVLEMPAVVWDAEQGLYHMYYWGLPDGAIYTCYARSQDGLHWEKPVLGLHAGPDGSKKNNIVLRGEGTQARTRYVAINPYSDRPERKFVMLYIDNVPGLTEFAAYSPDGVHWTTTAKIGDLRKVTVAPPTADPPFFLIEQQWTKGPAGGNRYRAIWRTQSADMENWGGGRHIVERLPDDDPNLEFYHATSHFLGHRSYHGLHLGYLFLFHTDPDGRLLADGTRMAGTIDTGLMVSRDTIAWTRVDRRKRFFPLGEQGAWDGGMNFVMPEIPVGDELRFYYGGWRLGHDAGSDNDGAIGLATLRLDGFVSVEPQSQKGSLTTKPFKLTGTKLRVNADASGGRLHAALLAADGRPLPGFTAQDCRPVTDDALDAPIEWRGDGALKSLVGQTVRLQFHLQAAKLYAFRIVR